jgi:hypothetical protein
MAGSTAAKRGGRGSSAVSGKAHKGQDRQNNDDQTDEIDDVVHLSFSYSSSVERDGQAKPPLPTPSSNRSRDRLFRRSGTTPRPPKIFWRRDEQNGLQRVQDRTAPRRGSPTHSAT